MKDSFKKAVVYCFIGGVVTAVLGGATMSAYAATPDERDAEQLNRLRSMGDTQLDKLQLENQLRSQLKDAELIGILDQMIPLTEVDVKIAKKEITDVRRSVKESVDGVPDHIMGYQRLSVEDAKPIHIKVAPGFMSSIVFADQLGNPWPVRKAVNANDTAFGVIEDGNVLTITMKEMVGVGNVSVMLDGLNAPVVLILQSDHKEVHGRFDVKIDQLKPGTELTSAMLDYDMFTAGDNYDDIALQILNSNPPQNAAVYKINGLASAYAYAVGDQYYIVMNDRLITPDWGYGSITPSGKRIYRIDRQHSRIYVNVKGRKQWFDIGEPIYAPATGR